jgi:3-isopropylmalate/(R)-2-methylmalate dehydratase large subunit
MAGKTISEKILSIKSGVDARAGDLVICNVDYAMGTDGSVPMALDYFDQMGGDTVFDPTRIFFVMDHYNPVAGHKNAELHDRMRVFASKHGIAVYDVGSGISHQLMVENGRTRPGGLLVGADSHSVTGGALNAFATGIGSSDLAATMICGKIWLKVPHTIKVIFDGQPKPGVYPKDIALALSGMLSADGAAYQTLEFHGSAAAEMELEDRLVLSNMSVEMGAKAGIFLCDQKTIRYLQGRTTEPLYPIEPDSDAVYSKEIVIDVSKLEPKIARPHTVDNVTALRDGQDIPIQMVYLGTCTGGRVNDFHQALEILEKAGRIAQGVKLVVSPASMEIEAELETDGTLARLRHFGAIVTVSGCGSCCGTAGPIPDDGVNVMSTANRNFKARMGNGQASIYLGSPAACAAAAVTGKITDPNSIYDIANEN